MSNPTHPYFNDSTNEDKADALRNDAKLRKGDRQASTYHAQAMAGLDDPAPGGRFAQDRYVTGQEPGTNYPRLPESSPWAGDAVPPEEPLGYSINDLQVCGETHEQEQLAQEVQPGCDTSRAREAEVTGVSSVSSSNLVEGSELTPLAVGSAAASSTAALRQSLDHPHDNRMQMRRRKLK